VRERERVKIKRKKKKEEGEKEKERKTYHLPGCLFYFFLIFIYLYRKKKQKSSITEKMAGFVPRQNKFCIKITGLPSQDKVERLVYASLREGNLNVQVKAVRRVISTEYESASNWATVYVYLHQSENSYVDQIARRINDSDFEGEKDVDTR